MTKDIQIFWAVEDIELSRQINTNGYNLKSQLYYTHIFNTMIRLRMSHER